MSMVCGCIVACVLASGQSGDPAHRAAPQRIIANAPSNAEIVWALGAGDRLVGVSRYVSYPPELEELPRLGGLEDPDLEAILALKPDLILQRGHNEHVARLCERRGIILYLDRTDSLPSLFATIGEIGELLDDAEAAADLTRALRSRLDEVRAKAPATPPRVLFVLRSPDRLAPLTTVGKPSYLSAVIEVAGGHNVFGHVDVSYPQIGLEEVIAARPEIILDVLPGEVIDAARRKTLLGQWQAVGAIPAVTTGRVHFLTEDYVLVPSPRVVLLAERLVKIFTSVAQTSER